jgi:hypothetical protein
MFALVERVSKKVSMHQKQEEKKGDALCAKREKREHTAHTHTREAKRGEKRERSVSLLNI